jgi:hypothetical protein
MIHIPALLSLVIYLILGIICLIMALKTIITKKFLPFHEKAAGKDWQTIDLPLQQVIITLLRITGIGFLTVFLFLFSFPIMNYLKPATELKFLIPIIPFIFCLGLFVFNYSLFKKTNVKTPWRGALISMVAIAIGFYLSLL